MRIRRFLPVVLAAFLLISGGRLLLQSLGSFKASDVSNDAATSWDARMRLVLAALPSEVSVVGYLEGADLDPSVPGPEAAEFYLTQYGLAPVVLLTGADHDWIVGNFGNTLASAEIRSDLDQKLGSYSIQDFGFGIYLIHRPRR